MKVYVNNHNGIAIVSANSEYEAHGVLLTEDDTMMHFFSVKDWELIPGLEDNTKTPRVISYHVNSY